MEIWNFIREKYTTGIPVILLYVLQSKASSPGRQGFKMTIAADGSHCGSIGGGIMEHKFVEMAKVRMQQNNAEAGVYRQIHNKEAGKDQSGMICSGEQTIFLYLVQESDQVAIQALIDSIKKNRNGTLELSNNGIRFSDDIPLKDFLFEQSENAFTLIEKTGFKNVLHIIGGGHCSLALSRIMSEMDFYIHVYEEREGLNTLDQNNYAHSKNIMRSYSDIHSLIEGGKEVYVVIMTFGYRTDDIALRALMNNKFRYLGILGSKKKIDKMFTDYRREGIKEEIIASIHAPIGIQINSQAPAEIAISIAAEIISVKNNA